MINLNGIIQNNRTASDFIKKCSRQQGKYGIIGKEEERKMIEANAKLVLTDGKIKYNENYECDYEWTGDEDAVRKELVLRNLAAVAQLAKKHCQDTRDFDNMYARGLYGLTKAANLFHPFKLIVKKGAIQYDENGKPTFIKFNTFAQWWIFKHIMDEFYQKSIKVDNNTTSLNELMSAHSNNGKQVTLENFLSTMLAPEIAPKKDSLDEIADSETSAIYDSLHKYIKTAKKFTDIEKSVLEETFYGDSEKSLRKLSSILKIPQKTILENQISGLEKLKDFLIEEYGIDSLSDII